MASSSTSSIYKKFKYDVFLSFRGEDTRTNFVDHLYHALRQKSIHTYKDDPNIKKGKNISDELIRSIEDSKFYIIVFSKNYASSSWCLDELVKIMECHRTKEHTAYPVFYDVEPSEVRKQSGAVAAAFAKHEKEEAAGIWRDALKEAADLAGWELKKTADGLETILIQKIVEVLSLELHAIGFNIDEMLVGMESRIEDLVSSLATSCDDVRMIGIKGMGGGGKTTLARAVFDQISFRFEGKSFVENVREVANASLSGLKSLQNQVLYDVLKDKDIKVSSVFEGKHMMKRMMPNWKVLVVLDDVDHKDHLEALAGEPNWFKPGSRIIITTRDEQVLVAHRVKFIHDVTLLSDREGICLFSRYAFEKEIPDEGYEELSRQVIRYAAGLPLTIRVLGSFFCGKSKLQWIDALERLKMVPLTETLKKLEFSYTSLENDYKEIFLDIACILKGWRTDLAIKALESCGFHAKVGLKVLEQKSLITIKTHYSNPYHEYVDMHDHIQELGRNIVRRSHPDKPHKHSRLWIAEEIEEIMANDLGTKATRCIQFDAGNLNPYIVIKGLRKMKELRFLSVVLGVNTRDLNFDNITIPNLPNALQYLSVDYYPFRYLPETFQANNLVALKMLDSKIVQLWEGGEKKVLKKLKFLDLSRSMLSILDLGLTPNIETLSLRRCFDLAELRMSTGCLKLISFDITHSRLRTLDFRLAPNLETLNVGYCYYLEEMQMADEYQKLKSLNITHSRLSTLDFGLAPNIRRLNLGNCYNLQELYMVDEYERLISVDITHLSLRTLDLGLAPNLKRLNLENCYNLEEFHMAEEYQQLISLNITHSRLKTLDFGLAPNLETLKIAECPNLVELRMSIGCLKLTSLNITHSRLRSLDLGLAPNLKTLNLAECRGLLDIRMSTRCLKLILVDITHSRLRTLDIGLASNLENLNLKNCYYLEELHMAEEYQKLANMNISHSKLRTLNLGLTPNLKRLHLKRCSNLVELHTPTGCLKKLVNLDVSGCLGFSTFLYYLFDNTYCGVDESVEVGPLAKLYLSLKSVKRCPLHPDNSLPKFQFSCFYGEDRPSFTRNLEMLSSLGMCACIDLARFSDCICGLRRLKKLRLEGNILQLLKDLDRLECLEELTLSCTKIKHLPDSICTLKHLKYLELDRCFLLENLPEDLGQLECLEKLGLSYTKVKHLPDSICTLKHLKSLELDNCSLLEKLPEDLGRLDCLEELLLDKCKILQDIPNSIGKMRSLKRFHLHYCIRVEKFPEEFGNLTCLKDLDIEGTSISHLPLSILLLKDVRIIGPRGLVLPCSFTSDLQTSEC